MITCDAHCHFFSSGFFQKLGADAGVADDAAVALPARLGWEAPGTDETLADRWVAELDARGVSRAMLIASVPGDEASVAAAVQRHRQRFVGAFMFNPAAPHPPAGPAPSVTARLERSFVELGLRTVCLFPAMHQYSVDDKRVEEVFVAAEAHGRAVFVHCGVLSVGVRKKLGLPSRFDLRLGDPLGVGAVAVRHPKVPVIIPHFGAGFLREALMAADQASNIVLDSSSSNSWVKFDPRLTVRDAFARALDCIGPERLMFGTDSSFFPRGWQQPVFDAQRAILDDLGVNAAAQGAIFGGNFTRIFG
jgi:predicted TIM-barrel fold metal-dependent hydrolase